MIILKNFHHHRHHHGYYILIHNTGPCHHAPALWTNDPRGPATFCDLDCTRNFWDLAAPRRGESDEVCACSPRWIYHIRRLEIKIKLIFVGGKLPWQWNSCTESVMIRNMFLNGYNRTTLQNKWVSFEVWKAKMPKMPNVGNLAKESPRIVLASCTIAKPVATQTNVSGNYRCKCHYVFTSQPKCIFLLQQ